MDPLPIPFVFCLACGYRMLIGLKEYHEFQCESLKRVNEYYKLLVQVDGA